MISSRSDNQFQNQTQRKEDPNATVDLNVYAYMSMPTDQIVAILKAQGKSEADIDRTLATVKVQKRKIKGIVTRVNDKLTKKGFADTHSIIQVVTKIANDSNLSEIEKRVILDQMIKGDSAILNNNNSDLNYGPMAKLLGFNMYNSHYLNMNPKDTGKINELNQIYQNNKYLFNDVKNQSYLYKDCSIDAVTGRFVSDKHIPSIHIHPVVAMMFFPKISIFERLMLRASIPRLILQRYPLLAQQYNLGDNLMPGEIEGEFELTQNIANDPTGVYLFNNENPMDNLIKRARCQVELWKNVYNLRNGRYYSTSYNEDDGINGYTKLLNNTDFTNYDTPEMYTLQNETSVLNKTLAIFSLRPTIAEISTPINRDTPAYLGFGTSTSRSKFTYLSVINVRLTRPPAGAANFSVDLENTYTQSDILLQNNLLLVPRNKSIVYSNEVAFFTIERRYNLSPNIAGVQMGFSRFVSLPVNFSSTSTMNDTQVTFGNTIKIGNVAFKIRSAVILRTTAIAANDPQVVVGSATVLSVPQNIETGLYRNDFFIYNPAMATSKYARNGQYQANDPVSRLPEYSSDPEAPGFRDLVQNKGSVLLFTKDTDTRLSPFTV